MTQEQSIQIAKDISNIYGYDISHYDSRFIQSILNKFADIHNIHGYENIKKFILTDETLVNQFVNMLFINVSTMFRDADVFRYLANEILPYINSYHTIKIWSAGCANGEEIYSIAILLKELGIYDKSILYATDIDEDAITRAKNGKYRIKNGLEFCQNYYLSGQNGNFNKYFDIDNDFLSIKPELKNNICFASHNIITDDVFNTFSLILCRNLFIYFDNQLQEKALKLFHNSLETSGFLVLGQSESIKYNNGQKYFKEVDRKNNIYKKKEISDKF
jgi:chemotaxis protein methyltransferase CheR